MNPNDFTIDFWAFFKRLVTELKIQPSEAWRLDLLECFKLLDIEIEQKQDTSMMLNYKRMANGGDRNWLMR